MKPSLARPESKNQSGNNTTYKKIAGVRTRNGPFHGVEAWFSGYNLDIGKDQASYSQIYIGSGSNNQVNFISAGFMINPGFFPDGRIWSYGFWKGKDGKGCYNTACSGFVQVSKEIPIVQPIDNLKPGESTWWHSGANMVGVGGVVQASRSGSSPPMGNGNFPENKFPVTHPKRSAIFTNIEVLNYHYERPSSLGFYFNYGGPGGNSCGI
ncbi:unnamed protein product [Arabis nemorensis]|uniref:Neprosin PEP catalytic domain-containing protein n=1 Tax=Arabis nemorensis TaxID=586526 RepID=A0A565CU64_9BRAS|nr:unnamed protein product [Arabis nemorensis]